MQQPPAPFIPPTVKDPESFYQAAAPRRRKKTLEPGLENFPLIHDIYDVVPMPLTYAVPCETNGMPFVRDVSKDPPAFDSNPYCFTLPNVTNTFDDFVSAMGATIRWVPRKKELLNGRGNLTSAEAAARDAQRTTKKPGPRRVHERTWIWDCPCANEKQERPERIPESAQVRKGKASYKCQCPARYFIKQRIDNAHFEVEWFWKHEGHNPYSLEDMQKMRVPKCVTEWLSERVVAGLTWPAIKRLLLTTDLFPVGLFSWQCSCSSLFVLIWPAGYLQDDPDNATIVPESLKVDYQHVANLIRAQAQQLTRLDSDSFQSLRKWARKLQADGWNVLSDIKREPKAEVFLCFFSPWQQQQLQFYGKDLVCLDSTHNTTKNFPHTLDIKLSLFTFVVRSPVTGRGIPVVWYLSSDEKASVLLAGMI